jgi:archaellum component FlaC
MNDALEILKYTVPSLIVFLTAFIIIRNQYKNEEAKRKADTVITNKKTVLPIRLQAYERLALLLERVSPEAIIMRQNLSNITAKQLQAELLNSIRAEFDHNLSQQVYISTETWERIKNTRSNIISLINNAAQQIEPNASAYTLSTKILDLVMEHKNSLTAPALEMIKKEIQELF